MPPKETVPQEEPLDPCLICRGPLVEPFILYCNHIFCDYCITHWFDHIPSSWNFRNRYCPYCHTYLVYRNCGHRYWPVALGTRPHSRIATPPDLCPDCLESDESRLQDYLISLSTKEGPHVPLAEGEWPPEILNAARLTGHRIYGVRTEAELEILADEEGRSPPTRWEDKPPVGYLGAMRNFLTRNNPLRDPNEVYSERQEQELRAAAWNTVPFIWITNVANEFFIRNVVLKKVERGFPNTNGVYDDCLVCKKPLEPLDEAVAQPVRYSRKQSKWKRIPGGYDWGPIGIEDNKWVVKLPCTHYYHLGCLGCIWSLGECGIEMPNSEIRKACPACDAPYRIAMYPQHRWLNTRQTN